MNGASRLLRSTSSFSGGSGGGSSSNLLSAAASPAPAPPLPLLGPSAIPRSLEEELESQARASLAVLGLGAQTLNWTPAAPPSDGVGVAGVKLLERVAPLGANSLLWRTVNDRDGGGGDVGGGSSAAGAAGGTSEGGPTLAASASSSSLSTDDEDGDWDAGAPVIGAGAAHSGLQQYLVKCVAILPSAALEEVVEMLVRSDRDDMEAVMLQLVGARTSASGFVYRRKKRRSRAAALARQAPSNGPRKRLPLAARRPHKAPPPSVGGGGPATVAAAKATRRRLALPKGDASDDGEDEEDESSASESDDDDAAVVVQDDLAALNVGLPLGASLGRAGGRAGTRRVARLQSLEAAAPPAATASLGSNRSSPGFGHAHSWSSLPSPPMAPPPTGSYMDGYRRAMARSGHQGNLSIKWVAGDKPSRMFGARATYCLLDYECELVNDWDDHASGSSSPMYVRVLRSCYLPQCQPWLDELGGRPRNVQPVGIMVRQCPASKRGGSELRAPPSVEVQVVASILERPLLPAAARRAKLRALCARLGRLEDLVTSRRLSHSLLTTQPLWVRDQERPGCRSCGARFGFSRRRHHCRICGEICCAECCPKVDLALPEVGSASVRVCVSCRHSQRRKSTEASTPTRSSSAVSSPAFAAATTTPSNADPPLRRATSTGSATSGRESPATSSQRRPPPPPPSTPTVTTPPRPTAATSLSPSADHHYLASLSSYGPAVDFGGPGDRKPSIASSVLHKLKSSASFT